MKRQLGLGFAKFSPLRITLAEFLRRTVDRMDRRECLDHVIALNQIGPLDIEVGKATHNEPECAQSSNDNSDKH
jgi:hypothetical protein